MQGEALTAQIQWLKWIVVTIHLNELQSEYTNTWMRKKQKKFSIKFHQ